MNPDILRDLTQRLIADFEFKLVGEWLRTGKCPDCGKKEAYTHAEHPWVIRCARDNKCGASTHVKTLYPELFNNWTKRYPITPENPNAAADAYLSQARGFDLGKIASWYSQGLYTNQELNAASSTVRFMLSNGSYWERIIDKPERFGNRKATFHGKYAGLWWAPRSLDISMLTTSSQLWIVEGIFDAIALMHHGISAVAAMSCTNYPHLALADLAEKSKSRPTLVWALDSDKAGKSAIKKYVERARAEGWDCTAAQIPQKNGSKQDWNDLHLIDKLNAKECERYQYFGALLIVDSAPKKAILLRGHTGQSKFTFEFNDRLFAFEFNLDKYSKACDRILESNPHISEENLAEQAAAECSFTTKICDAHPQVLYYQAHEDTDESWYYLRITFPHDGPPVKATCTSAQISSAIEFKKRLLAVAPGAMYTGTSGHLDDYLKRQIFNIKRVRTIDYVGYSVEHKAFITSNLAISGGQAYAANDEDFFDIGRLSIKTISGSVPLSINTDLSDFQIDWLDLIWQCYGPNGIIALSFWLGALFAQQIRLENKSLPFLEVVGEPGSGKTTLIEFLWKLCGRQSYEGFDPAKASMAAMSRNLAQVANLPVVFIEGDRGGDALRSRSFDFDETKPLYDGRAIRARGVRSAGNETYEPPFKGALVIAQNAPVLASEAVLQRIVQLFFTRNSHSVDSKNANDALARYDIKHLSGFLVTALKKSDAVMDVFKARREVFESDMLGNGAVKNIRVIKNHAQMHALVDALGIVLPTMPHSMRTQVHTVIDQLAQERERAITADHAVVAQFWDAYEYLNNSDEYPVLNHAKDSKLIAINLNHMAEIAAEHKQILPPHADLIKRLPGSIYRKFVEIKTVNSAINTRLNADTFNNKKLLPTSIKCYVFEQYADAKARR